MKYRTLKTGSVLLLVVVFNLTEKQAGSVRSDLADRLPDVFVSSLLVSLKLASHDHAY